MKERNKEQNKIEQEKARKKDTINDTNKRKTKDG